VVDANSHCPGKPIAVAGGGEPGSPRANESLLNRVLGLAPISEDAQRDSEEPMTPAEHNLFKGQFILKREFTGDGHSHINLGRHIK
jgi:hypothetical protein